MKLPRKMITASVVGVMAVSMFFGNAANAATTDAENLNNDAQAEKVAVAIYYNISAAADPQQAYDNLSAEERAAFDGYFLAAEAEEVYTLTQTDAAGRALGNSKTFTSKDEAMASVAAAQACWIGTSKYTMKAALGNAIWDTWTEGTWCGSGSSVTSASFNRSWSTIAALGWRDGGQLASGQGIAGGQARMWSQRQMILGAGGIDVQTMQPCNRLNGTANGGTSQTWSCSIV